MMNKAWVAFKGIVERGHGVASGLAGDDRFPRGTVAMQMPFFAERGLDLSAYHRGTLNISIRPHVWRMQRPEHTFRQVRWTTALPPEDFSFSRCAVVFGGARYEAWIYCPHPETKKEHFQDPSVLEVIAPSIPGLSYGGAVEILLNLNEVQVRGPDPGGSDQSCPLPANRL
jgi:hypothetical protein